MAAKNSLLVVMGYGKLSINPGLDKLIDDFYYNIIGPYWDKERKYIDEHYQTIPFPFEELVTPSFKNEYEWTLDHLLGYLTTWSAVKHYNQQNGNNPIDLIKKELAACWGNAEKRTIHFPLLLRIGKIVH